MPTSRSYHDACGIARALDVLGERWALLIVRELLLGPQRFADLRAALPQASSNIVTDRLRELGAHGVVARRRLPAPGAAWVYELTPHGREAEPIVLALGDWGVRLPPRDDTAALSATSTLIYLRSAARPDPAWPPAVYRVQLGAQVWTVRAADGAVSVTQGDPAGCDAGLATDPRTLNALLGDPDRLAGAERAGTAVVTGDRAALLRLLDAVPAAGRTAPASPPRV
ncbi:winged helix-turn-helix transcriptional regulator [Catenuloplanes indicus]|uniref:DNA-binding HxlR family transcriptional regulator n=1 Tax=Catenuloplanes indicus TaxID=137267 RepID=A0AAE3VVL0_9ACTN|nr:winged helix-turn-helix transcriptional regulator [Catenuloplanes indicus]MDQ0364422.1 DNA-binding HxlR family transcriptional regulator [Catenuloplanes indicus]